MKRTAANRSDRATTRSDYPAANTDAVVTLAADADEMHVLKKIYWSYDVGPVGRLYVAIDGVTKLDVDITSSGPGFLPFDDGLYGGEKNKSLVVTLAAGGAAVTGKLTVITE